MTEGPEPDGSGPFSYGSYGSGAGLMRAPPGPAASITQRSPMTETRPCGNEAHGERQAAMLLAQHPSREVLHRVVRQDRHRCLDDDRPAVDLGSHEVNRAAGDAHAGLDGPRMGVEPLERGQQRGVDVDQPIAPAAHKFRREDAHEAGEADQLDTARFQRFAQRLLEGSAGAIRPVIDHALGQAGLCGPREPEGIGPVGKHQRNLALGIGRGAIVDEGLKIGPATRDQDAHSQPRHIVPYPPAAAVLELRPVALLQTP